MYLLEKELYDSMKNIVSNNGTNTLVQAVLEQIQEGMVYADNKENPKAYLIRNSSGAYFVGGDPTQKQFTEKLVEYLKDKNNHKIYFDLYSSSNEWIDIIEKELIGNVVRLGRVNYKYSPYGEKEKIQTEELQEPFRMVAMDESLYERYVSEIDGSYTAIFSSSHDFVTKSFGFCILNQDEIVSTCNAYHVCSHMAEVDVFTNNNYRNQGYGTIVVDAFVEYCKKKKLLAVWNADKGNEISQHLAQKCGFEYTYEEDELWWHEDKKQIEQYLRNYKYIE